MKTAQGTISTARDLMRAQQHLAAAELLSSAINSDPNDSDLACEYGTLLCFLQREDEAVRLLPSAKGAAGFDRFASILQSYFHCRELMAAKLGVDDVLGKQLASEISKTLSIPQSQIQNPKSKIQYSARAQPRDPKSAIRNPKSKIQNLPGISLSACLIVKNEQKHLERCLKSIHGKVDEIVVVDTGSTDRTVAIAESFGAKIGHFEWCDDFAAARNESLRLATGRWVLWIDADEEVEPSSWNGIAEGLIRPQFGGFYVQIVNLMDDEGRSQYVHSPVRIFQRLPEVRFEGRIHEQVLQCFDRLDMPCATLQNVKLIHHGYTPEEMRAKNKAERTIRMLEREVAEAPKDAFQWFNLANAFSVGRRREDAVRAARECLKHIDPANAFGSLCSQILSSNLTALGRPEEALEACGEAVARGFHTLLTDFERAHALLNLRRFEEALEAIEKCLASDWPLGMTGDYGIVTHKALALKGQVLSEMERLDEAEECLAKALTVDPSFAVALYARGINLERQGRPQEALESLSKAFENSDFGRPARRAAARIAQATGDVASAKKWLEEAWRLVPADKDAWAQWTRLVEAGGDPSEMVRCYEAYAEHHEPNADVFVNWARACERLGEPQKALGCYEKALAADPADANALFNLGDLLYRLGEFGQASEAYQTALRILPENAEGWFVLGNALAQMGVGEGARIAYGQVLVLCPDHRAARNNMAVVESIAA